MKKLILAMALVLLPASAFAWGNDVHVDGYHRNDGTYVQPHHRTAPDNNPYNNYSSPGNTNPYTGERSSSSYDNNWNSSRSSSNIGGIDSFGSNKNYRGW